MWGALTAAMYKALEEHREAVKRVRDQLRATQDDLGTVLGILDELAKGYNPNGQDMAVKAAVVGYRELIGDVESEGEEEKPEAKLHTVRAPDEHLTGFDVERVINVDLDSLLVDDLNDDDDDGLRESFCRSRRARGRARRACLWQDPGSLSQLSEKTLAVGG